MKKLFKILPVIAIIIVCSFVMIKVFADNKIEVKEYLQGNGFTAVLYSNNKLYIWGSAPYNTENYINEVVENIQDIFITYEQKLGVIDTNNNLKIIYPSMTGYDDETNEGIFGIVTTKILKNNVKKSDGKYIITNDNKLYKFSYYNWDEPDYEETLIMENVKEVKYNDYNGPTYLILDNNNNLYAYGYNMYGKKINDGENITESPIKIAENVKEFDYSGYYNNFNPYYITNDNKLYIMSNKLPYPKLLKKNVDKYLYGRYYISEGKTYELQYTISLDEIVIKKDELIIKNELKSIGTDYEEQYGNYKFYLTTNGDLYDPLYNKVGSNIKQLYHSHDEEYYIIKEDGTLSIITYNHIYDLYANKVQEIKEKKLLINVKEIINDNTLIMEDGTIYIKGISSYYDIADFNGKKESNYKNYVVIKGLPNVKENITLSQINLHHNDKTNLTIGETADYYVDVYPFNAENKEIEWSSSDETVAKVSQKGTLTALKAGTTTIKVKNKTLDIYDEIEITVHPKNTGLEILEAEEITVNSYEYKTLKVKVTPDNVLEQRLKWTTNAGNDENDDEIIRFYGQNGYITTCTEKYCPKEYNEIIFMSRKPGTYIITVTTEDGLYSDSIKVNVEQEITDISINPDRNHYLGATLYIYMNESNTMDLKPKIYPEDATDKEVEYEISDPSIATVDETGKVTAKKAGKVTITIKAKNNDVKSEFNILIFDKTIDTKLGDFDGDGIVDILDVVKLRKHLAGVKE